MCDILCSVVLVEFISSLFRALSNCPALSLQESKDNHCRGNGSRSHGEDGITSFTCAVLACCRRQQRRLWDHYTAWIGLCRIVDFCGIITFSWIFRFCTSLPGSS
jgi:hypothetical protein